MKQNIATWAPSYNFVGLYISNCMYRQSEKVVKQQYLLQMSPRYGELRPTNGWDPLTSFGHPCKFQRVSRLGSVTARYSTSGCQPNFAALNRGRHLYLAGRPSRWASAHILVVYVVGCPRHPHRRSPSYVHTVVWTNAAFHWTRKVVLQLPDWKIGQYDFPL